MGEWGITSFAFFLFFRNITCVLTGTVSLSELTSMSSNNYFRCKLGHIKGKGASAHVQNAHIQIPPMHAQCLIQA